MQIKKNNIGVFLYYIRSYMSTTTRESWIISPGDPTLGRFSICAMKKLTGIPGFGYDSSTIFTEQK